MTCPVPSAPCARSTPHPASRCRCSCGRLLANHPPLPRPVIWGGWQSTRGVDVKVHQGPAPAWGEGGRFGQRPPKVTV